MSKQHKRLVQRDPWLWKNLNRRKNVEERRLSRLFPRVLYIPISKIFWRTLVKFV